MFLRFIQPCSPVLANTVPAGDDWRHEIKFDGFRVQIHKLGNEVELFSRNGSRFSRRFPRLVSVLREMPAKSVILDGEIVASDAEAVELDLVLPVVTSVVKQTNVVSKWGLYPLLRHAIEETPATYAGRCRAYVHPGPDAAMGHFREFCDECDVLPEWLAILG